MTITRMLRSCAISVLLMVTSLAGSGMASAQTIAPATDQPAVIDQAAAPIAGSYDGSGTYIFNVPTGPGYRVAFIDQAGYQFYDEPTTPTGYGQHATVVISDKAIGVRFNLIGPDGNVAATGPVNP